MSHDFIHRYLPGTDPSAPVLLMLHGTGGNEDDLLPLGRQLVPGATLLSPRGQVLENGMPRFFRRLAEGVFDIEDLRARTATLAEFIQASAKRYGFDRSRLVAVGFSNGANIAASLLVLNPGLLGGAVLFRAMVPLAPDPVAVTTRTPVLLSNGRMDPLVAGGETERLKALLERFGADVTLELQNAGHNLVENDLAVAQRWLARFGRAAGPASI
jgi:predicted esterase